MDRKGLPEATVEAIRAAASVPKPRRFYRVVTVGESEDGFVLALDGKPARTPGKAKLVLPTRALAAAVAEEWEAQSEVIDAARMPLTRLMNSAIDGVVPRRHEVAADAARYADSDMICYRAEYPAALVRLQQQHWDPILEWAASELGLMLRTGAGIGHVAQPADATGRIGALLEGYSAARLAALHSMTTLTGSVVLALAHVHGRLDAEAAWTAAHVDEDWQISQWGADDEATARRASRWEEFAAASRVYFLCP